ncbi:MAG: hypothetical protein JSS44_05450 [Proteobacteria bacterium]|nr:hypothetical protein [Pseudomonadota bacterium]
MQDHDETPPRDRRTYGPFVSECKARGIGRTVAFDLKRKGLIEVFYIGSKPLVLLDSLDSLPERLAAQGRAA